jgi:hypothetical protein
MILVEDGQQPDFKAKDDLQLEPTGSRSASQPLDDLPPTFEESANDNLFATEYSAAVPNPPFQDAPPDFSPYNASYFTLSNGPVISHDPHLNEDGKGKR